MDIKEKNIEMKEIVEKEDLVAIYPIMNQLRTHLSLEQFLTMVGDMKEDGYRLFALEDEKKIVALAGVAVVTNLYNGRHLFVYDLVTDQKNRSAGYGANLLFCLHQFAKENGCTLVELSSGVQRVDAHRFYENKMGYSKTSFMYRKSL
jgi:GNAT superfamily N-acetyltransferase